MKAFFESLEIGAVDAWTLFLSLDIDGDNLISIDEFMERCVQLRGPARSVDLYAIRRLNASRQSSFSCQVSSSSVVFDRVCEVGSPRTTCLVHVCVCV